MDSDIPDLIEDAELLPTLTVEYKVWNSLDDYSRIAGGWERSSRSHPTTTIRASEMITTRRVSTKIMMREGIFGTYSAAPAHHDESYWPILTYWSEPQWRLDGTYTAMEKLHMANMTSVEKTLYQLNPSRLELDLIKQHA